MAACLITVTGTEGLLRLDYKIGVDSFSIQTTIGSFYIDDTATDVTYTRLTGDVTASSGCLTIAELPAVCYSLFWKGLTGIVNYNIESIILGSEVISLPLIKFPESDLLLPEAVNSIGDSRIQIVGYSLFYDWSAYPTSFINNSFGYIIKVVGSEIPILKIRNSDASGYIYIYGESTSCTLPGGYTPIDPCYPSFPTTTTTTAPL